MTRARMLGYCLIATALAASSGCRSTNRFFQIDSNSGVPWFGLNVPLGDARDSESDADDRVLAATERRPQQETIVATADRRREPQRPAARLLPNWLTGRDEAIPLPSDIPLAQQQATTPLGPQEEFP